MKKVVLDTSSIISLSLIGLLAKCLQNFEIIIPKSVIKELKDASTYKDAIGKVATDVVKLITQGKIVVYSVKDHGNVRSLLSSDVGLGEAECLVCCIENKIPLLVTDDIDAMYSLEDIAVINDIETNISIWLLAELEGNRIITKENAVTYIKRLIKLREWEGGVLEVLSEKYLEKL